MREGFYAELLALLETQLGESNDDDKAEAWRWQRELLREAAAREIDGRPTEPIQKLLGTDPSWGHVN